MKRIAFGILVAMALFLAVPLSGHAGKKRVFDGVNHRQVHKARWEHHVRRKSYVRWRHSPRRPRYYWGGVIVLKPWYPYGYYAAPPAAIQQQPPVYIEKEEQESGYWYYCQEAQAYYPYVKSCPGGWMKVVPEVTPPPVKEDIKP